MKFLKCFTSIVVIFFVFSLNSFAEEINVKKFGAKGDGKTNDTKAIQAAINACHEGSQNIIYFPKGVYILGGYNITNNYLENYFLRIHSNITFKCALALLSVLSKI